MHVMSTCTVYIHDLCDVCVRGCELVIVYVYLCFVYYNMHVSVHISVFKY